MKGISIFLVAIFTFGICANLQAQQAKSAVLVVGNHSYQQRIDPEFKDKLNKLGYQVDTSSYEELTYDKMKQFNCLILYCIARDVFKNEVETLNRIKGDIYKYVEEGGGLILTNDGGPEITRAVNPFFKEFGLEVLNETIVDEKNEFRQKNFAQYYFFTTKNIIDSPITEGIDSLTFPLGWGVIQRMTTTMNVDDNWKVVVCAEESAKSYDDGSKISTYDSQPPLVAMRQFGKGRIVIATVHCSFTVQAGYHMIYEGLVMEKGNVFKLFDNSIRWVSAPSLASGVLGGFVQTDFSREVKWGSAPDILEPKNEKTPHTPRYKNAYKGIVGAKSSLSSDGSGTLEEYVAEAKKHGYDFIIFTENLADMNKEIFDKYVADCAKLSSDDFLAMPGISYQDTQGNNFIAYRLQSWPSDDVLSEDKTRIYSHPGFLFGQNWVGVVLTKINKNPGVPWLLKFYTGFAIYTYEQNKLIDEAFTIYLRQMANDYQTSPYSIRYITRPDQIADFDGYETYTFGDTITKSLLTFNNFNATFISNGPVITDWVVDNYWFKPRNEMWTGHISVKSDSKIAKLTIYDGREPYLTLYPDSNEVKQDFSAHHDRQRFLFVEATDELGRRAISNSWNTGAIEHSIYMCADKQNTLDGGYVLDKENNRAFFSPMMGFYVTGWAGGGNPLFLVPGEILMPENLDLVMKGFDGGPNPWIKTQEFSEVGIVASRDMYMGSPDVTILDSYWTMRLVPDGSSTTPDNLTSFSRTTSYTPEAYSYNILRVDTKTTLVKDVDFTNVDGIELTIFDYAGSLDTFSKYEYVSADGSIVSEEFSPDVKITNGTIAKNGYMWIGDDFYGAFGVVAVDNEIDFTLWNYGSSWDLNLGYELGGKKAEKGAEYQLSILPIRGKFGETGPGGMRMIHDLYGFDRTPGYSINLTQGENLDGLFPVILKAADYKVTGSITQCDLPNELPLQIEGLNDNWDAAVYYSDDGTLNWIAVKDGTGYARVDTSKERNIFIGNIVTCDNKDVVLKVLNWDNGELEVEVNNPTESAVTVTITGAPEVSLTKDISEKIDLKAGEFTTISLR